MRTFRLIGTALLAVVVGVSFIACSDDEEDEIIKDDNGIVTNQKRLKEIKMFKDYKTVTWSFAYDAKGRLIAVDELSDYPENEEEPSLNVIEYIWGDNSIVEVWNNRTSTTYYLANNLVKNSTYKYGDGYTYTYNSSNQLSSIQTVQVDETLVDTYTWEDGRIVKWIGTGGYYTEISECTYSGKTCKGYFPLYIPECGDDDAIFYAHPELVGLRCSHLPDQIYHKDEYYEQTFKYSYTLDDDGYVENCTMVETGDSSGGPFVDTNVFTFKWE